MDKIFKAMADPNRRKILALLMNNKLTVSQILKDFSISQATLSSHLSILRKSKLVSFEIKGRLRIYYINKELMREFVSRLNQFIGDVVINDIDNVEIRRR